MEKWTTKAFQQAIEHYSQNDDFLKTLLDKPELTGFEAKLDAQIRELCRDSAFFGFAAGFNYAMLAAKQHQEYVDNKSTPNSGDN
jgi:hypothetical protein